MNRKGFTLIELLVVIAIIAILAAILFPVFAQAKQAAKAAASLSNAKQQGTAFAMYQGDSDDYMPLVTAWNTGSDPVCFGQACASPWTWLIQPYMKSGDILLDPLSPPLQTPAGFPRTVVAALNPTYGYNYDWLDPYYADQGASVASQHPISATGMANPADTVLIASKYSTQEWNYSRAGTTGLAFSWNAGQDNGPLLNTTMDAPDCWTILSYCIDNWGAGASQWNSILGNNPTAGSLTGGNSRRAADNTIVVFTDSHAKKMRPGALGTGTNWSPTRQYNTLTVTDTSKYLWDDK